MDLSKSREFFDPSELSSRINIIGCGSVGSTIAENLARCGITKMTLWDFDKVEPHNIVNQMFRSDDVGKYKVEALRGILEEINPDIKDDLSIKKGGWKGEMMSGYIFLCVDNIELRKKIVLQHFDHPYVKAVFDFRTLLQSAQHYAADWSDRRMKETLLNSMNFTHEEATEETPTSACGVTLGVVTTVRAICALGVNNFLNFVKGEGIKKMINFDCFHYILDAF